MEFVNIARPDLLNAGTAIRTVVNFDNTKLTSS